MLNEDIAPVADKKASLAEADLQSESSSFFGSLTAQLKTWLQFKGSVTQSEFEPLPLWLWVLFS
ncbi:MAG: hypothetical protein RBT25_06565, partial [Lentisphaeria bacterium]|nr:hypothetical protein [Lentisphaeria bacterium]